MEPSIYSMISAEHLEKALKEQFANAGLFWSPARSTISGGSSMKPEEHSEVQALAQQVRSLAQDHPGIDLGQITRAVDAARQEHKSRIQRALEGIAQLEQTKKVKGRRFLVAYWYREASGVAEGIEYEPREDAKGEVRNYSVLIDCAEHPFSAQYRTMGDFRKFFATCDIPFTIVYRD